MSFESGTRPPEECAMTAIDGFGMARVAARPGRAASLDWQTLVGIVAFTALLVLSLPGVKVARADAPAADASATEASQQCAVPQESSAPMAVRVRRELADPARAKAHPEIVVLNTRGYNYGNPPRVDPQSVMREVRVAPR